LFKNAALGANGNITLFHDDGTVIMRWPQQEIAGRNLKNAEIFKYAAAAHDGRFESFSATDGTHRLFVFSRIAELPLLLSVGQPTDDIYAEWRRYAFVVGVLITCLCVMGGTLAWSLAREMRRRAAAERKLAMLAATDGLTGLSNRRHLNDSIHSEWRRAMRDHAPLALMMIDADHFKAYNDLHGHQAGDKMLQTIAAAMFRSIRRPADVASRYGGDEFAILLPATSATAAVMVAEKVRTCLAALCAENGVPPSNVSIGIASRVPKPGDSFGELLAAADEALYRAKENGRNCTQTAPQQPDFRSSRAA
jgi:diguanylate cyclase (GGDEF)-like protein